MATAFVTAFSSCNVSSASVVDNASTSTPTLNVTVINPDPLDTAFQQFLYGVSDVNGKTCTHSIPLTNKEGGASILAGWDGPWKSTDPNSLTGWTRITGWSVTSGVLTFTDTPTNATMYYASTPPLTLGRVLNWLNAIQSAYPTLVHDDLRPRVRLADGPFICGRSGTHRDDLSRTVSNLPMYGVRIGNDSAGPQSPSAKAEIIIFAGVHSGEWLGFQMLMGLVDEWCSNADLATVRNNVDLYIYPCHSVGGVELGFRRAEAINATNNSYDANREWADGDGTIPTVTAWQDIIDEQHGVFLHNVAAFYDLHDGTPSGSNGVVWFNYMSGMANLTAITNILAAENSDWNAEVTTVDGTTIEYMSVKGKNLALNFEIREEQASYDGAQDYGASIARATKGFYDAGYLADIDGRRLGDIETEDFESGTGIWTLNTGTVAWTRHTGATGTTNTGADNAYRGSWRIYTEAGVSGTPIALGATCIAEATGLDFSSMAEFVFHWCRFGCRTDSPLTVEVDNGSGYTQVKSITTNLSVANYKREGIDLSSYNSTNGKIRLIVTFNSTTSRHLNDNDLDTLQFVYFAESTAIDATPNDSLSAGTLDAATVTQEHVTTPNDSLSASTTDSPVVSQHFTATAADSLSASATESPTVTAGLAATPVDSRSLSSSDQPTVSQHFTATPNESLSGSTVESPAITQEHVVSPADSRSLSSADQPTVTQKHIAMVADSTSASTTDAPAVTQEVFATPADSRSLTFLEVPTIAGAGTALVADSRSLGTLDQAPVTQKHIATPTDSLSLTYLEVPSVGNFLLASPADSRSLSSIESPSVQLKIFAQPADSTSAGVLDQPFIFKDNYTFINDMRSNSFMESPFVMGPNYTVPDLVVVVVPPVDNSADVPI